MKKLPLLAFAISASCLTAETLPTTIIGGGEDFLTIDSISNPSMVTVNSGDNGYAGIEGGTISYVIPPSSGATNKNIFEIKSDFEIKSPIEIEYQGTSYETSTNVKFIVSNGATLKIDNFKVVGDSAANGSRTCLIGTSSAQAKIYFTAADNSIGYSTLYSEYADVYLTGPLTCGMLYLWRGANINLNGDLHSLSAFYMQPGADVPANMNLNGYNYIGHATFVSEDAKNPNSILNVTFGDDADGDGKVVFSNYTVGGIQISNAEIHFLDYDRESDLVLFRTKLSDSLQDSLLVFEGYEGMSVEVETITWDGTTYYSYYVIPEPSAIAACFGMLSLLCAFIARRKNK